MALPSLHEIDSLIVAHRSTIRALEASLHKERNALSATLRLKNEHVPLHALPPEILAIIFEMHAFYSWVDGVSNASLIVSWVCHLWRALALDLPRLWTYHILPSTLWQQFLPRCRDMGLRVSLGNRTSRDVAEMDSTMRDYLRQCSDRIERFHVQNIILRDFEPLDGSNLKEVLITYHIIPAYVVWWMPHIVMDVSIPSLTHLTIHNCYLDETISKLFCPTLTYLWILRSDHLSDILVDYSVLLHLLRGTPCLQELRLTHVMPSTASQTDPAHPEIDIVQLPLLHTLAIIDLHQLLPFYLEYVDVPLLRELNFGIHQWEGAISTESLTCITRQASISMAVDSEEYYPALLALLTSPSGCLAWICECSVARQRGLHECAKDLLGLEICRFTTQNICRLKHKLSQVHSLDIGPIPRDTDALGLVNALVLALPNLRSLSVSGWLSLSILPTLLRHGLGHEYHSYGEPSIPNRPLLFTKLDTLCLDTRKLQTSRKPVHGIFTHIADAMRARRYLMPSFSTLSFVSYSENSISDGEWQIVEGVEDMCWQSGRYTAHWPSGVVSEECRRVNENYEVGNESDSSEDDWDDGLDVWLIKYDFSDPLTVDGQRAL